MTQPQPRVLLGDSSPSTLSPDVLDVLVQLVTCARDVGIAYAEIQDLELQRGKGLESSTALVSALDRFRNDSEFGMRATALDSKREEVRRHAEEAIIAVGKLIEGWQRSYRQAHERDERRIGERIRDLEKTMRGSLERLALPQREGFRARRLRRTFQGEQYANSLEAEWVPGLRVQLSAPDSGSESPMRMRTLLGGKSARIQVGTKKALLRRTEEPNFVQLDEWLILDARVGPGAARLHLSRKASGQETLDLEIAAEGGAIAARASRPDGSAETLPADDHPTLREIWQALQAELARTFRSSGALTALQLDGDAVQGADLLLRTMETLVSWYRPIVEEIATHSPNADELNIKIEREDGRREEAYVYRADLGQNLLALPRELRRLIGIPALLPAGDLTEHRVIPGLAPILEPDAGTNSGRIELDPDAPGTPIEEVTEDISLRDLVLEGSGILELDVEPDRCADQPIVLRSTGR